MSIIKNGLAWLGIGFCVGTGFWASLGLLYLIYNWYALQLMMAMLG